MTAPRPGCSLSSGPDEGKQPGVRSRTPQAGGRAARASRETPSSWGDCGSAGHWRCSGVHFCVECIDWRPLGITPMPWTGRGPRGAGSVPGAWGRVLSLGGPPPPPPTHTTRGLMVVCAWTGGGLGTDALGACRRGPRSGGGGVQAPQGGGDLVPHVPGPTWTTRGAEATVPPPSPAGRPAWPVPPRTAPPSGQAWARTTPGAPLSGLT